MVVEKLIIIPFGDGSSAAEVEPVGLSEIVNLFRPPKERGSLVANFCLSVPV